MIYVAIAAPWVLLLVILWMLLVGQPAGQAQLVQQRDDLKAENAMLWATLYVRVGPTKTPCYYGTKAC